MLRTVIIDDEPLVIEGLSTMIDWQKHGFRICGFAEDGEKGLETIEKLKPDVVFTDVRMPGLDGLTLVKEYLQRCSEPIFFVIITGYSEFDYIKKAMDLNVVDYLLKPIDPDAVHQILNRIQNEYNRKVDLKKKHDMDIRNVTRMTLNRLIDEEDKPSLVTRGNMLLDLDNHNFYLYGFSKPTIKQILSEHTYNHEAIDILSVKENESRQSWVIWGEKEKIMEWVQEIKEFFLAKTYVDDCFLYVSEPTKDIQLIGQLHQLLSAYHKNRFYDPSTFIQIDIDSKIDFSREITIFEQDPLFGTFELVDYDRAIFDLKKIFHQIYVKRIEPELVKMRYLLFRERIGQAVNNDFSSTNPENYTDIRGACQILIDNYFLNRGLNPYSLTTDNIQKYVEDHMSEDLRLKALAKVFNYNSVYVGQFFQKETGIKFRDYVLEVRMVRAKELLLHTGKSVGNIAQAVGFKDRDYFVRKFKEIYKCLPGDYRNEK